MILVKVNTVRDASILSDALNSLINKGYQELSEIEAGAPNAIEQSTRWDETINSAKRIQGEVSTQIQKFK